MTFPKNQNIVYFILATLLIFQVGCEPDCEDHVSPTCNLEVLDSEISLNKIDDIEVDDLSTIIEVDTGMHIISGTSSRNECENEEDVVGTVFGVVNPLSSGNIFVQGLSANASRLTDVWNVGIFIRGSSQERSEITAIVVDPFYAEEIFALEKDTTITNLNELKDRLKSKGIFFKDSPVIQIRIK